ncbi:hypothetical protein LOTGIDRAFT_103736 [Lottia gigantea]|uniref:Prokaryotic-type class I peptide chain release factors domain-containing protein n=1 Tax=Lottia gigantea TaxID=225164 RepID=V4ALD7_LOTGI|nr:hypothetical protein LOTGIDRAFT_103736 [Lottia gigantea]ESO97917.1 hypothetical protein LOTGIDRAFT_103736 [Lottia gigantea]
MLRSLVQLTKPTTLVNINNSTRLISKKNYKFPELLESDLEESFVRGSGSGGQKINKTNSNVVLKHKPTGIVISCQDSRLQNENRVFARQRLKEKLDYLYNGENSYFALKKAENNKQRASTKSKNQKKRELKSAFHEREGLD